MELSNFMAMEPAMLYSLLNMKLRNDDGSLNDLARSLDIDEQALVALHRLEERQLPGAFFTPLLARASPEVARRVTLAQTAIFEDVDLLAGGVAEVAAHEAANSPAHSRIGATEVQEMLLGLVGCKQHRPVLGQRVLTARLGTVMPLMVMGLSKWFKVFI